MESELGRVLGLAANECALHGVGFDCSALRQGERTARARGSGWKPDGRLTPLGVESSVLRHGRCVGAIRALNPRVRLRGHRRSTRPPSAKGNDSAGDEADLIHR
jgi:hypothetical protein